MTDFDQLDFDPETGLLPAVVQSAGDDGVRMLGYMDREALARTLEEGRVTFFSRSRGELWEKGETSGDWLETVEVRADCDGDALLVRAIPHGPTCHTGRPSCFEAGPAFGAGAADAAGGGGRDEPTRRPRPGGGPDLSGASGSPAPVLASVLEELVGVVAERDRDRPAGSYTADLLEAGPDTARRKVGEEALEVVLARDDLERLAEESADLLYHLVVLWRAEGLNPEAVGERLAERRGASGGDGADGSRAAGEPGPGGGRP